MFVLCPLTLRMTGIFSLLYTSLKETGCLPVSGFVWQPSLDPRSLWSLLTELVKREQVAPQAVGGGSGPGLCPVSSSCARDCQGPQRPLLCSSKRTRPRSLPSRNATM